jgi:hypothetical protein
MNSIFGDATTIAPTPETLAEAESLFSGNRSPVPELRLGDDRVPDMDLTPPDVEVQDGKPIINDGKSGEGVAGWISNMSERIRRGGNDNASASGSGKYRRVGQGDEH